MAEKIYSQYIDRAKEMNINLIILDKDINKFKHTLIEAINKK